MGDPHREPPTPGGSEPAMAAEADAHRRRDISIVIAVLLLGLAAFAWVIFNIGRDEPEADIGVNITVTREEGQNLAFPEAGDEMNLGLPGGEANGALEAPADVPEVNA